MTELLASLTGKLRTAGLRIRGGFHPDAGDGVPDCAAGQPCATLILIGNVGSELWPAFSRSRPRARINPLDEWTKSTVDPIARSLGAAAVYPFDGPPYHPFQRWAQRCEPVQVSPIGVLIHPVWGLWHAYRAALLFADPLNLPARDAAPAPCLACAEKPCLSACPVHAFSASGYDVEACVDLVADEHAKAGETCRSHTCQARLACPVGRDQAYAPEQGRFHMRAFIAACRRPA